MAATFGSLMVNVSEFYVISLSGNIQKQVLDVAHVKGLLLEVLICNK